MQQRCLKFAVSENLLTNVPKFFTSPEAILAELFQNAFRAGATKVQIEYRTEANSISIWDDGSGTFPDVLLNAGLSDWDKLSPAVNPAGLGVFSLLWKEYVKLVTYWSRDWRMDLTEESITSGATVEYGYPLISGTRVSILLADGVTFDLNRIGKARGMYPLRFEIGFDDEELKVLEPFFLSAEEYLRLEIPGVGTVSLGLRPYPRNVLTMHDRVLAIWQHAVVNGLEAALNKAAQPLADKVIRDCLGSSDLVLIWEIDPACRVSPGLPNRDTLIKDNHLAAAAKKIIQAIDEYISSAFDLQKLAVIQRVDGVKEAQQLLRTLRLDNRAFSEYLIDWHVHSLMRRFGFIQVDLDDPSDDHFYLDLEGALEWEVGFSRSVQFFRSEFVIDVPDESMAICLNLQGIPARCATLSRWPTIQVEGLHDTGGAVAFAKQITVNGAQVEYLVRGTECEWECEALDGAKEAGGLFMVTTWSPQKYLAMLKKAETYQLIRAFFARFRYTVDYLDGFYHCEDNDFHFDNIAIEEELCTPALRALLGHEQADAIALDISNVSNFLATVSDSRWDLHYFRGRSILVKIMVYSLLKLMSTTIWIANKYRVVLENKVDKDLSKNNLITYVTCL
jgi:hypothetical protein